MSTSAAQECDTPDQRHRAVRLWVLLGAVGLATIAAAVLGGSSPMIATLPVLGLTACVIAARVPLRWSVAVLLAVLLGADIPSDTGGLWHSPLLVLGAGLQGNIPGLKVTVFEGVVLFLLGVAASRRATGSVIDGESWTPTARVLRDFVLLYALGLLFAEANGVLRGGSAALWKLRNLAQIPVLFLLFNVAIRGPEDHRLFGSVIVFAALVKSALAGWIQYVIAPRTGGRLEYATNHGDSILFTVALVLLLANLAERPERRPLHRALLFVPPILVGMVANGRRLVWIMFALSVLVAYFISPWRPWKRSLTKKLLPIVALLGLYAVVGWNSGSALFAPLRLVHTVSDGSVDLSTRWRDIENWNICMSMRESPMLGIGLGREYTEAMHNGDISSFFPEYRQWPHNTVLGLLLFAGVVGFTAMWLLHAIVVFLAARCHRLATAPEDRAAAITSLAMTIACMTLAYGDLGANFVQYRVFWALALAVVGKLAVATGAWPAPRALRQ
jgi:O-antigen ligase